MVDYAADNSGPNQKAQNVEKIYIDQGPAAGLAALRDDFAKTMSAPGTNPTDGAAQNWMEYSRLVADDTGASVMNGLALEWASQQINSRGATELDYTSLMPAADKNADPNLPNVQLDQVMARDLKANWVENANLTGAGQDDVPMDAGTVPFYSSEIQSARSSAEADRQVMIKEENPEPPPKLSLWQTIANDIESDAGLSTLGADSQG